MQGSSWSLFPDHITVVSVMDSTVGKHQI
uniref:Uncharacterized protein n=1 Tax=Arundo donax TaxID=35708 RepID=A0A0A9ELK8_ARUDO